LFSVLLRAVFPKGIIGGSIFDDDLFVRSAGYLMHGEWLGPYDKVTLAKGFFYPLFIAASSTAHLPLQVAEGLIYAAFCGLAGVYVGRHSTRWFGFCVYIALLMNPVFWNVELLRVIRENLYTPLSLGVVVLSAAALFSHRRWLAFAAGVVMACFWMTREEGVWIIPCLAILLAAAAFDMRRNLRRLIPPLVIFAASFAVPCAVVSAINYSHYGEFDTVEFHDSDFVAAYGALARIHQDHWQRYVVFPADARQRAYEVSEAARQLRPYLDGRVYAIWARTSCGQVGDPDCKEVGAGWFMWAFRDAVTASGNADSGAQAKAFYRKLAAEINDACDRRKIPCESPRSTLAPIFHQEYIGETLEGVWPLTKLIFQFGNQVINRPFSVGTPADLAWASARIGQAAPLRTMHLSLRGWVASREPIQSISLGNLGLQAEPAPDVLKAHPDMNTARFSGDLECRSDQCNIDVNSTKIVPRQGVPMNTKDMIVLLDDYEAVSLNSHPSIRIAIARRIALVYKWIMPPLAAFAVIGLLAGIAGAVRSRSIGVILTLALASACACMTRIVLLAYLDATSIPSINTLYSSPATPFAILFIACGLYSGLQTGKSWLSARRLARSA
jgi:hypothetical protein